MSFIYPRKISFFRLPKTIATGKLPYQTSRKNEEQLIFKDLSASIQRSSQSMSLVKLPSSTTGSVWNIFIPKKELRLGEILIHDIVVDDQELRYRVLTPYWNSLGYKLFCEVLIN